MAAETTDAREKLRQALTQLITETDSAPVVEPVVAAAPGESGGDPFASTPEDDAEVEALWQQAQAAGAPAEARLDDQAAAELMGLLDEAEAPQGAGPAEAGPAPATEAAVAAETPPTNPFDVTLEELDLDPQTRAWVEQEFPPEEAPAPVPPEDLTQAFDREATIAGARAALASGEIDGEALRTLREALQVGVIDEEFIRQNAGDRAQEWLEALTAAKAEVAQGLAPATQEMDRAFSWRERVRQWPGKVAHFLRVTFGPSENTKDNWAFWLFGTAGGMAFGTLAPYTWTPVAAAGISFVLRHALEKYYTHQTKNVRNFAARLTAMAAEQPREESEMQRLTGEINASLEEQLEKMKHDTNRYVASWVSGFITGSTTATLARVLVGFAEAGQQATPTHPTEATTQPAATHPAAEAGTAAHPTSVTPGAEAGGVHGAHGAPSGGEGGKPGPAEQGVPGETPPHVTPPVEKPADLATQLLQHPVKVEGQGDNLYNALIRQMQTMGVPDFKGPYGRSHHESVVMSVINALEKNGYDVSVQPDKAYNVLATLKSEDPKAWGFVQDYIKASDADGILAVSKAFHKAGY